MLVRKCDVCGHIIGDEVGYMVEISRTSMSRSEREKRISTIQDTVELCYECKSAIYSALNERMTKYVLMGKEEEEEKQ